MVSTSAAIAQLQMVQSKQFLTSDDGNDNAYEGWDFADGILRMLTGQPINPEPFDPLRLFTVTNLKGIKLGPTTSINHLFGSINYEAAFLKTWGVN